MSGSVIEMGLNKDPSIITPKKLDSVNNIEDG